MAALKGQFILASNTYGLAADVTGMVGQPIQWQAGALQYLVHQCPNSLAHPSKFYGRGPASITGTIQLKATDYRTFLNDIHVETLRHAGWLDADGTEVYAHVYAGEMTGPLEWLQPNVTPAAALLVRVSFKFICPDQRLYKTSDNSVLVGA
jgi:hypothetical protein